MKPLRNLRKDKTIEAKVSDIDVEKERISLSIKDLLDDPFSKVVKSLKRGDQLSQRLLLPYKKVE